MQAYMFGHDCDLSEVAVLEDTCSASIFSASLMMFQHGWARADQGPSLSVRSGFLQALGSEDGCSLKSVQSAD